MLLLGVRPLQSCSLNLKLPIGNWPCPCPNLEGGQESKCLKDRKEDGLAFQAHRAVCGQSWSETHSL